MQDRSEYEFDVEGDNQQDWYAIGLEKLENELAIINGPPSTYLIETWRTIPEVDEPGKDKTDGIATRSSLQKVRFDLIPIAPLVEVAKVFSFGAYHYGDRNWEAGFSWSRCIGSVWRHFTKWLLGEELDDESGLNHLAHVIVNVLFLMQYTFTKKGVDDRQKMDSTFITKLFTSINANTTLRKE